MKVAITVKHRAGPERTPEASESKVAKPTEAQLRAWAKWLIDYEAGYIDIESIECRDEAHRRVVLVAKALLDRLPKGF